jgi:hypothetical protein
MCFLDNFKVGQGSSSYKVRRVTEFLNKKETPWKSGKTGVMGFGPKSDLIDYIYDQYSVTPIQPFLDATDYSFGIAIRLNAKNEQDKWTGDLAGTFGDSYITLNGYKDKDINPVEGIKWTKSSLNTWGINLGEIKITMDSDNDVEVANTNLCLDFTSPGAIILPEKSPKIQEIKDYVMKALCGQTECDSSVDIKTGPTLTLKVSLDKGEDYTVKLIASEYIYIDPATKKIKVSISSLEQSKNNQRC